MLRNFFSSVRSLRILAALYVILAIAAAAQSYLLTVKTSSGGPAQITKYNNYVIFKSSHFHLLDGKNLYREYPDEHWDLYKYSPTFALFFGCLAWFPDWLGLTLWNLLNVVVFFLAVRFLPGLDDRRKNWILLLSAVDAMTAMQNSQSNLLVAGLLILGFGLLEKKNYFLATLCIVATFYIKIFGIVALILLIFYPGKGKSMFYALFWMAILWIIPAVVTGFGPLTAHYLQYAGMLKNDQSVSLGLSVMGWIKTWFGLDVSKTLLAMAGFVIMCIPLARFRIFSEYPNRILFASALLIWMVIFNHKAESPTFIIATAAVYTWYFSATRTKVNMALLCMVILFTSLSSTDLFPHPVRVGLLEPYLVKVVPCILVWIKIVADMLKGKMPAALPQAGESRPVK